MRPYLPPSALEIHTPLRMDKWSAALRSHPNRVSAEVLVEGLWTGVQIGHNPVHLCKRARTNCRSAHDHPEVIDRYLANELALRRVAGPFPDNFSGIMISRFGVIPKPGQPGKWRLIVDLSAPALASVNDGITLDSGMAYSSVADAAQIILQLGQGTEMAKIDIAKCLSTAIFTA